MIDATSIFYITITVLAVPFICIIIVLIIMYRMMKKMEEEDKNER